MAIIKYLLYCIYRMASGNEDARILHSQFLAGDDVMKAIAEMDEKISNIRRGRDNLVLRCLVEEREGERRAMFKKTSELLEGPLAKLQQYLQQSTELYEYLVNAGAFFDDVS